MPESDVIIDDNNIGKLANGSERLKILVKIKIVKMYTKRDNIKAKQILINEFIFYLKYLILHHKIQFQQS